MLRQHQFSKVELVSIAQPGQVRRRARAHDRAAPKTVLKRLELPYRVVVLCTGDMGFAARKTYDIEVWLPGQETLSRDFELLELRRLPGAAHEGALSARPGEKGTRFVHTLNGSGLAVGRTLIAILENYQQADGSVVVPRGAAALYGRPGGDRARWLRGRRSTLAARASWSPTTTASTRPASRCWSASPAALSPRRLGGGAGGRAERRQPLADAAPAAAAAQSVDAPLRGRRHADRLRAAGGPATSLKDRRPDLVLSGINRGANLGEDVTYSGTVAAAMEATLLGIPAIALSQVRDGRSADSIGRRRAHAADA